jgi:hypothetical protein
LKNIDATLAAIDATAEKQGLTKSAIETANRQIRIALATTTDLQAEFSKVVSAKSRQANTAQSTVQKISTAIMNIFLPNQAFAATGFPFGGLVVTPIPCNGGIWNIVITPLPPTMVPVLTYLPGSQAFASYTLNTPHPGMQILGEFVPGPGACVIGIIPIPSAGIISPMTGSSL